MSLLEQAAADVRAILENTDEFGLPMTVTSPIGDVATITGFAADIGQEIDPETGQLVSGRRIHATLPVAAIHEAFGEQLRGVHDEAMLPWRITLQLPSMPTAQVFKVMDVMPDKIGAVVCWLEIFGD